MFLHAVYFWKNAELTDEQRADFRRGLETLKSVETVQRVHIGMPVPSARGVVDGSFAFSLVIEFADQQAHDIYQEHPTHKQFITDCSQYWSRVQVYDSVE